MASNRVAWLSLFQWIIATSSVTWPALSYAQFLNHEMLAERREIKVGMVNDQSGATAQCGLDLYQGALACFQRLNQSGGVAGRTIRLISYDDNFIPLNTVVATERLIDQDHVFALMGFFGTPTSTAAAAMAKEAGIIFLGPVTGAQILRQEIKSTVINLRPSYGDEVHHLIAHLKSDLGVSRLAVLHQSDAFGEDVFRALTEQAAQNGIAIVADAPIERKSSDVGRAVEEVAAARPEAILVPASPRIAALFIYGVKKKGVDRAVICLFSTFPVNSLISQLGKDVEGLVVSEVLPHWDDQKISVMRSYQSDMRAGSFTRFSYLSLEGYLEATYLVQALRQTGTNLTVDRLRAALASVTIDLGDTRLRAGELESGLNHHVYLSQVRGGQLVQVNHLSR